MINYNSDGSIKLPESLEKMQEGSRSAKIRYDTLFAKARDKQIKVLFLVENPEIAKNIYSDNPVENPLIKLFDAFDIKIDDINVALEKLLEKGYFIIYVEKDQYQNQGVLKASLADLNPEKIVAIGDQFDKKLGFLRDDLRFVDEKIELDDNFTGKIKSIIKADKEVKKKKDTT